MIIPLGVVAILLTLLFTVLNGARDAAAILAVAVRSRALTPTVGVIFAAIFNLLGVCVAALFLARVDLHVASGNTGTEAFVVLISATLAASAWGLLQWRIGYPSSSSHALLGGLAGALGVAALKGYPIVDGLWQWMLWFVLVPLLVSPLLAFLAAYLLVLPSTWLSRFSTPRKLNQRFRSWQAVLSAVVALAHGFQDGSRIIAVTLATLLAAGMTRSAGLTVTVTVVIGLALAAGTLLGGWRIAYTLSQRLVPATPLYGLVSQLVSSVFLTVGGLVQVPMATTQLATASLIGAGVNRRGGRFNVDLAGKIALGWIATPLVSAAGSATIYLALSLLL